jgi:DNA invertase Pin-like site-specific DNA recombinase
VPRLEAAKLISPQHLRPQINPAESTTTIDRPKFKELLGFCHNKKNRVNVVVVNSISRFARDKYSHFTVRTLLSRLNITLRSVSEPIDDSPTGKLVEGILSTIAQFENDDKAVRNQPIKSRLIC